MSEFTPYRAVARETGRVYQETEDDDVLIDWVPPCPFHGHTRLTCGRVQKHPTEGKIVTFRETVKIGRKVQTVCARLTGRDDLVELVRIAEEMDAAALAEVKTERERGAAEYAAKKAADIAAFEATLPAGYAPLDSVKHDPNAADGWGLTTYRHAGFELSSGDVHALEPKFHHPLGNSYDLRVYVPADKLAALVERKRGEKAEKDAAKAAKLAAREADRAVKIAQARETGKPVELARWTEGCDGSVDECSTDIVYRLAQPDGTIMIERIHTH